MSTNLKYFAAYEQEDRRRPERKEFWERYDAKNTENCYNDTNVRMLANWRSDQYQYDPNLRCDVNYYNQDFTKYPYNDDDIATLCKNGASPSLPLPNNLRGVQRLNNGAVRLMNL